MLRLNDVTIARGTRILYEHATAVADAADRVGLVGENGCGKSSLFAAILGELAPEAGTIDAPPLERISHVAQSVVETDEEALAYVLSGHAPLMAAKKEAEEAAESGDAMREAAALAQLAEVNEGAVRAQALTIMGGLGFLPADATALVKSFSGGWRNRLALARALMRPADLLLLDEPTNHLDIFMRETLTDALSAYTGTLLLVTHDRYLMQTLGCPILYLEDGKATFYQNFQKLHDRDTSKQPEPAKQEDKPQKAGYGKEQRRRRAEVRTRLKALETEIEELGAHIVELENEINDPEVLRDHLLLRDKCDELDDSRFHQQELYDEWEKLAEEQDRMDAESDS